MIAVSTCCWRGIVAASGTLRQFGTTLRHAAFAVVSIATTTGFVTEDYERWPAFVGYWLLFLSCICCNTGSTGGGIKMFRTLLLWRQALREMRLMVHPQAVEPIRIGGQVVANRIAYAVLAFIFLVLHDRGHADLRAVALGTGFRQLVVRRASLRSTTSGRD